jgi:hypothetical protein
VHVAIDDCTRLAYAEVLPDEKAITVIAFLRRAVAFYERHGMTVQRLLTDHGSAYHRRHSALGRKPPITRLTERNNLPRTYG